MKEKIKKILQEIVTPDDSLDNINDFISGRHIDSFETLMLINSLELEFNVKFDFDDNLIDNLNSVDKIEALLKSKLGSSGEELKEESNVLCNICPKCNKRIVKKK